MSLVSLVTIISCVLIVAQGVKPDSMAVGSLLRGPRHPLRHTSVSPDCHPLPERSHARLLHLPCVRGRDSNPRLGRKAPCSIQTELPRRPVPADPCRSLRALTAYRWNECMRAFDYLANHALGWAPLRPSRGFHGAHHARLIPNRHRSPPSVPRPRSVSVEARGRLNLGRFSRPSTDDYVTRSLILCQPEEGDRDSVRDGIADRTSQARRPR